MQGQGYTNLWPIAVQHEAEAVVKMSELLKKKSMRLERLQFRTEGQDVLAAKG